ncbi:uncharacterized protein LAJ45_04378 [Morchella importuna]|uniref:uncharacterized protein n=1 Tax=Morchella importuna TaxID=1174673 RepID=UPI001E8D4B0A|nr:uncharacterized protein LAJ45_04378 [Morchella importuna]KAH8151756.1 hypothetical protein LAJ45_04378 [Morchella importuna]
MDEDGNTPLHRAVCAGSRLAGPGEAVGVLLEWGADIEAKDERGRTPLACASEGANEGLVKMLLEKGADINTEDNAGQRVLHRAACGGNATVLKLLVEKGADGSVVDGCGVKPIGVAKDEEVKVLMASLGLGDEE